MYTWSKYLRNLNYAIHTLWSSDRIMWIAPFKRGWIAMADVGVHTVQNTCQSKHARLNCAFKLRIALHVLARLSYYRWKCAFRRSHLAPSCETQSLKLLMIHTTDDIGVICELHYRQTWPHPNTSVPFVFDVVCIVKCTMFLRTW